MGTQARDSDSDKAPNWLQWIVRHQRPALIVGAVLLAVGGGLWFAFAAADRREAFAARALRSARTAAEAGNFALAASDLSRLVNAYGGTVAAAEATMLLAQVRILQDQTALAIADLRSFTSGSPPAPFRGPAYALLGSALEEVGQLTEAAEAYERAAEAYPYDPLRAQYSLDAARAYTLAGDTASAAGLYADVIDRFEDAPGATEALVRLGELRPQTQGG